MNCIDYQDFYGFVRCHLQDKLVGLEDCSVCKDKVPWEKCPNRVIRNNEEDLCNLSGKECYREECNNKVIRRG